MVSRWVTLFSIALLVNSLSNVVAAERGGRRRGVEATQRAHCTGTLNLAGGAIDFTLLERKYIDLYDEPAAATPAPRREDYKDSKDYMQALMKSLWDTPQATRRSALAVQVRLAKLPHATADFPYRAGETIDLLLDPNQFSPLGGEIRFTGKQITRTTEKTADGKPLYQLESLLPANLLATDFKNAKPDLQLAWIRDAKRVGISEKVFEMGDAEIPATVDKMMKKWFVKSNANDLFDISEDSYSFIGKPYLSEVHVYRTQDGEFVGAQVWVTQDGAMTEDLITQHFRDRTEALLAGADVDADVVWRQGFFLTPKGEMLGTFTGDPGMSWFGH